MNGGCATWPGEPDDARPSDIARELLGGSCVTARNCLAVGIDRDALKGAGGPLAETWNGRARKGCLQAWARGPG